MDYRGHRHYVNWIGRYNRRGVNSRLGVEVISGFAQAVLSIAKVPLVLSMTSSGERGSKEGHSHQKAWDYHSWLLIH